MIRRHVAIPRLGARASCTAWNIPRWRRSYIPLLERPSIAQLLKSFDGGLTEAQRKRIPVNGFVRTVRKHKNVTFVTIGDGSSAESIQVVCQPWQVEGITTGTAVLFEGELKAAPPGKQQSHEIVAHGVSRLDDADQESYPLQNKYHSPEFLRTIPHLRSRNQINSSLLRLRSKSISALTQFFDKHEFIQTHPPVITSSDCEGAGEVFTVSAGAPKGTAAAAAAATNPNAPQPDAKGPHEPQTDGEAKNQPTVLSDVKDEPENFFKDPKYLTVSSQLHLESLAQSLSRVWCLSPTFRAERSDTPRHLSEFHMLEVEIAFLPKLGDLMLFLKLLIQDLVSSLGEPTLTELCSIQRYHDREGGAPIPLHTTTDLLTDRWRALQSPHWPMLSYSSALSVLSAASASGTARFSTEATWSSGLSTEHERHLATHIGKGAPVFITHYPLAQKPFYMLPTPRASLDQARTGHETAECFDLLLPDLCEVAGGSLREHRLAPLLGAMRRRGLVVPPEGPQGGQEQVRAGLEWYVDLRRWGSVPHGGFGIGFDRLLAYLAGVRNVRDVVTFPRWAGSCVC